ncbi:hypothetical protein AB6A40_002761 [Gnathostoma spinigerum]|uniref:Uncharacterized protein n=1 Tax=Gnathostoma spinigerum TaxID=75299 RepID=A0ABD6EH98_9BILA
MSQFDRKPYIGIWITVLANKELNLLIIEKCVVQKSWIIHAALGFFAIKLDVQEEQIKYEWEFPSPRLLDGLHLSIFTVKLLEYATIWSANCPPFPSSFRSYNCITEY